MKRVCLWFVVCGCRHRSPTELIEKMELGIGDVNNKQQTKNNKHFYF